MTSVLENQSVSAGAAILEFQGSSLDYLPDPHRLYWVQQESRVIWISYERRIANA
jgi:hypothetical protein